MKGKLLFIVIVLLLSMQAINAQQELKFELDYGRFNYDSTSVFTELYYDIIPEGMQTTPVEGGLKIEAVVSITLKNTIKDSLVINKKWKLSHVINPNDSTGNKSLAGVMGFVIPKGDYNLAVEVVDAKNASFKKVISEKLSIVPYKKDKYSISDIELARNIKNTETDPNSIFYKNTLEVTPNPSIVYSAESPVLFFYTELYNLKLADSTSQFTLQRAVYNSRGNSIYSVNKPIKQAGSAVVEVGTINLSKYPTDTYDLLLSLIDTKTKQAYVSTKRFFLYNPKIAAAAELATSNNGLLGSEYALLTQEECDELMQQSKYITTSNESDRYKKLDSLKAKQEFIYNFWKNRDTDPSTPKNEYKEDYMRRLATANLLFKVNKKPGYLTDRGRVLLLYGEPDQKDYYPNESNLKPYETWFYNQIEGGVQFIFGDPTGFGNYELLHSTMRGEYKDEDWQRRLSSQ